MVNLTFMPNIRQNSTDGIRKLNLKILYILYEIVFYIYKKGFVNSASFARLVLIFVRESL